MEDNLESINSNDCMLFTPLYGITAREPVCGLLTLKGCRILLDCGWCPPFDNQMLQPLQKYTLHKIQKLN